MKYIYEMHSVDSLEENLKHAKDIAIELSSLAGYAENIKSLEKSGYKISTEEKKLLQHTTNSLISQLRILNNSLPDIIKKVSFFKEIPTPKLKEKPKAKVKIKSKKQTKKEKLISFKYKHPSLEKKEALVTIKKGEKLKFLKELSLTNNSLKKLRKKREYMALRSKITEFKKPSKYAQYANRLFSEVSNRLVDKGYFLNLSRELRKANLSFLSHTYISIALLTSSIVLVFSFLLLILLLFFSLSFAFPFLALAGESIGLRFLKNFWIVIVFPILTFALFIFYPSIEKKSIAGRLKQELPFVVIHMSAIAGSKVEPTNIFKIIVKGREYPYTKKEIKKLLNQINVYGYDLVSALRSSARLTSSPHLSELFTGLATTITSGGNLSQFLDKRAETLIFDYKTEREKSTRVSETFMDIYISIVIAAPMIMTLLLVMMSISPALSIGLSLQATNLLMLLAIAFINLVFLVFLHLKQNEF